MKEKKSLSLKKSETGSSKTNPESENISLDTIREIAKKKTVFKSYKTHSYGATYQNKIVDLPGAPFSSRAEVIDALKWALDYEVWIHYYAKFDNDKSFDKTEFKLDDNLKEKIEDIIHQEFKIVRICEAIKVI